MLSLLVKAKRLAIGVFVVSLFAQAHTALGASVYNCTPSGTKCIAKVENGIIGDQVKILDEKAHIIGIGRIVKRKGSFAVVKVSRNWKTIRKGYPVIVNIQNRVSNLQWAAQFSNSD